MTPSIAPASTLTSADAAAHQAASYVRTTPLPMPERLAVNFDNYGSYWGVEGVASAIATVTAAYAAGEPVDEWNVTDRDGHPVRIVRIADPDFLDTITFIPLSPGSVR